MKEHDAAPDPRSTIPSINRLKEEVAGHLGAQCQNERLVTRLARMVAARMRETPRPQTTADLIREVLAPVTRPGPRPMINATGILLHTNLGRAPLRRETVRSALEEVAGYTDLELDRDSGKRGHRDRHFAALARTLWDVEDATLVNNAASAVCLALAALASGRETVVSRGELIEIGGSFRLPEIMSFAGTILREVGTTNKTRATDYARAIGSGTGCLLKTHPSNYRIEGFTEETDLAALVALGREHGLPVVLDLGSGLSEALTFPAVPEPTIEASLAAGPDVLMFSGDKLLGGIQAGIVLGKAAWIQRLRKHPMMRLVRADKLTISIVCHHLRDLAAGVPLPLSRLATVAPEDLKARARVIRDRLNGDWSLVEDFGFVGGGSLPQERRPTLSLTARFPKKTAFARRLRLGEPGVLGLIHDDRFVLNLSAVFPEEDALLIAKVNEAWRS
ncbi:L-seryl-tRNA(Sec) selenium transferase [Sulfidibacter corallicola]|uniref:L-seryl-tRNA(Sec) selenium transferase n=1 Tax=Sulfidibacter corallicola TaxID=2818388 RepID=A0A8A4TRL3_SULCO|nr:L-seryl-tRNA(Sec) selenium transferase [Sulfidibacter corallicola]QTD49175.1 L-seryl-tRNA(Sec) selenium transferase [Sulfidibacter corallicola]